MSYDKRNIKNHETLFIVIETFKPIFISDLMTFETTQNGEAFSLDNEFVIAISFSFNIAAVSNIRRKNR